MWKKKTYQYFVFRIVEKKLLIVKNWYFYGVIQQVFGFCAQKSNGLESILKLSKIKRWLKGHAWRNEKENKTIWKSVSFLLQYCFESKPGNPILEELVRISFQ